MPKILLAGQDVRLLETRAAVLRKTGAEVVYCTASHALKVVVSEMPDLLVLCHSMLHEEAEAIADGVHLCCPMTRVLLVISQLIADRPYRNAKFDATCLPEPSHLITCATEFLQGLPPPRARKITHDMPGPVAH
jgi:response regulator RpfG family c-di-GMP phosphodiesterase